MSGLRVVTATGVVQLTDTRNTIALLGKNSSPAGTKFTATGAGGTTYAFGYPQSASTYGLVTRDGFGAVLFDAVQYGRLARPVGTMSGNIQSVTTETKTQTFATGKTYAAWITSPVSFLSVRGGSVTIGGVVNYFYYLDDQEMTVSVSGATVSITATRTESTNANGGGSPTTYEAGGKYTWQAIVLDVTNF